MKHDPNIDSLVQAFEAHQVDGANFRHDDHIAVAYGLLGKYDFIDAVTIYARGIQTMAESVGAKQKFNTTITYAFMGLIAERMAVSETQDFKSFKAESPHLWSKSVLDQWYDPQRLNSDMARQIFLLPTMQA